MDICLRLQKRFLVFFLANAEQYSNLRRAITYKTVTLFFRGNQTMRIAPLKCRPRQPLRRRAVSLNQNRRKALPPRLIPKPVHETTRCDRDARARMAGRGKRFRDSAISHSVHSGTLRRLPRKSPAAFVQPTVNPLSFQ